MSSLASKTLLRVGVLVCLLALSVMNLVGVSATSIESHGTVDANGAPVYFCKVDGSEDTIVSSDGFKTAKAIKHDVDPHLSLDSAPSPSPSELAECVAFFFADATGPTGVLRLDLSSNLPVGPPTDVRLNHAMPGGVMAHVMDAFLIVMDAMYIGEIFPHWDTLSATSILPAWALDGNQASTKYQSSGLVGAAVSFVRETASNLGKLLRTARRPEQFAM